MNREDIEELHFIAAIKNVPSIMKHGIVSHNMSKRLKIVECDISEPGVQERRAVKEIPGTKKKLHDYANLYFDAHNPMLSARRSETNNICVLRLSPTVLDIDGVVITDQNAARPCWFKTVDEGLPLLDKDEVYMEFWTDSNNPINQYRLSGIKCAEVLVPNFIPTDYIVGAYAANEMALNKLCEISGLNAIIKNELFF